MQEQIRKEAILDDLNKNLKQVIEMLLEDREPKIEAERVLRKLWITPTEATRIFYSQICLQGGLPFSVEVPNELTSETLTKSRRGEDVQTFDSLEEMFESWPS